MLEMTKLTDEYFDDIRPYRDHEIKQVFKRLIKNPEIIDNARKFLFKRAPAFLIPLIKILVKIMLKIKLGRIKTVFDFQDKIVKDSVLVWIEKKTTNGISASGIEPLSKTQAYLFMSNHRDIAMDSALINFTLFKQGFNTSEIAFGDNLLMNAAVSDLIRINKSFIVKRNLPLRDQLRESVRLSEYIWYALKKRGSSIWIAQREGRAKDGNDLTQPVILKMLYLAHRKTDLSFEEFINQIRIVPVAISYELDPCDGMKAREIRKTATEGSYKKKKIEDLISIVKGLKGYKGRVHVAFGKPIVGNFQNEKEVAESINKTIHNNYKLWPSNYIAYDEIAEKKRYINFYSTGEKEKFLSRFSKMRDDDRKIALSIYANPVINKEKANDA